jgi:ABC-type multidrug transport system fused ATPase/permease subunit
MLARVAITAVSVVVRTHLYQWMALQAARRLFVSLIQSVFAAPMLFFETTPLGRIATRFSYDTELIDTTLGLAVAGERGCAYVCVWYVSIVCGCVRRYHAHAQACSMSTHS